MYRLGHSKLFGLIFGNIEYNPIMDNLDIYLRVSTDSQIDDGFGIENQKEVGLRVSVRYETNHLE